MKRILHLLELVTLFAVAIAYCKPAQAYVDLGTGSYVLQVSIAAVAGAILSVKVFWSALRNRFIRMVSSNRENSRVPRPGSDAQ